MPTYREIQVSDQQSSLSGCELVTQLKIVNKSEDNADVKLCSKQPSKVGNGYDGEIWYFRLMGIQIKLQDAYLKSISNLRFDEDDKFSLTISMIRRW